MNSGSQVEEWRDFYEKSWKYRMDYMNGLIEAGETCPYRVIQIFQNFERHHTIGMEDGKIVTVESPSEDDPSKLLPGGHPIFKNHIIRGAVQQTPYYMTEEHYRLIIDILNGGDFDCVVELGAGYGRYLLDIFYNGGPRKMKYIGAELTDSGCEMMQTLFPMVPGGDMEARKFDLLKPDFSFLRPFKRVLFYTVFAIQQVTEIPFKLVEEMSRAAEYVKTVHLEPFGFQVEPNLGEMTTRHAEHIREKGWNTNLGPMLVQGHNSGVIRLSHLVAEVMGGGLDPLSLAVWEGGGASKDS